MGLPLGGDDVVHEVADGDEAGEFAVFEHGEIALSQRPKIALSE